MFQLCLTASLGLLLLTPGLASADAPDATAAAAPADQPAENEAENEAEPKPLPMTPAEQAFAKTMSGATLVGQFTVGDAVAPQPERYELGQVRKVAQGKWVLPARIRYAKHDVTLPITLPVEWAGDTAVIIVDKVGFPGLGSYSARVMIHDGRYAGYWHGEGHGGHLFGKIEPAVAKSK